MNSRRNIATWDEFVKIVKEDFSYLETDFGFKLVSTQVPFVKYESPKVRMDIYWSIDTRHELDLGIIPLTKIEGIRSSIGISSLTLIHEPEKWGRFKE